MNPLLIGTNGTVCLEGDALPDEIRDAAVAVIKWTISIVIIIETYMISPLFITAVWIYFQIY